MKKFIILLYFIAVLFTVGCNSQSDSKKAEKTSSQSDLLSPLIGTKEGIIAKREMKNSPDFMLYDSLEIVRGSEIALKNSSNVSFTAGLENGLNIYMYVRSMKNEFNIDLDKNIIFSNFEKAVMSDIDIIDPAKCQAKINSIISDLAERKKTASPNELSKYIGISFGQGSKQQIKYSPDSAKYNANELIESTRLTIENNNPSFFQGLSMGQSLNNDISYFASKDIKLDKDIILEYYKKAVFSNSNNQTPIEKFDKQIDDILNEQ